MNEKKERKTRKVSENAFAAFEHSQSELGKEQAKENRKKTIERGEVDIKNLGREREHKQQQIDSGELLETHEAFLDKKKPLFMLHNEVDIIGKKIEETEENNKKMREMEEENE